MDVEKLIEHLERRGLSNGSSLGPHSGLYDEAADAFTALLAENEKLRAELEQMKKNMRENGIIVIPSKYPGGPAEWNIPKPRGPKED